MNPSPMPSSFVRALALLAAITFGPIAGAQVAFRGLGHLETETFDNAAFGISADGQVVVGYHTPPDGMNAFRWTQTGGIVGLGVILEGDINSRASDVSADGTYVVGDGAKLRGHDAFRWDAVNGMVSLGNLRGVARFFGNSTAYAVSDDGSLVVGVSDNFDFNAEGFIWTEPGGMLGIGDLSGGIFQSAAYGVSGDGQTVVGQSNSGLGDEAFRWTQLGGMVALGSFDNIPEVGVVSLAEDASFDGSTIVGWGLAFAESEDEPFQSQAFRWTQAGGMINLGDLPGGRFYSLANAVSADGAVVAGQGTSGGAPETAGLEAFVWRRTTGMKSVRDVLIGLGVDMTGWNLTSTTGISADGRTLTGFGLHGEVGEAWVATLPAFCPGDFNASGTVTVQDIFDFLSDYFMNRLTADVNASGTVTVQDVFDFLADYFTGCT